MSWSQPDELEKACAALKKTTLCEHPSRLRGKRIKRTVNRTDNISKRCFLASVLCCLVLACCGCASVNPHWNDPPPNVPNSGWQLLQPGIYYSKTL
jgi:hypothetical protein